MSINIGITITKDSYTPEAYAYADFLSRKGHKVELAYRLNPNNDINIYFMGLRPFWKYKSNRAIEIHEYHSLSTGSNPRIKNNLKAFINKKPEGRIFLNEVVRNDLKLRDNVPFIYRDMGVEDNMFQVPSTNPIYDIVYCGSIIGRKGLINTLIFLSQRFKVCVIGNINESDKKLLILNNITVLGPKSRIEIADIYKESCFGLNYTPDIYPFNIQTSTKTIEYLASGLHVISNKYKWIEDFSRFHDYEPIWLDTLMENFTEFSYDRSKLPSMSEYKWDNILEICKLENFLKKTLEK